MSDELILVNIYDKQLGTATKEEIHRKGLLHRAFSVFIYSEGKMLLQKRAADKYHSGGLWANACCSHPRDGERTAAAADRRLKEELGIGTRLKEVFSFVYRHQFKEDLFEYEYDHVYIGSYPEPDLEAIQPNKAEVDDVCWVDYEVLEKQLLEIPEAFAPWFLTAAPAVLRILRDY